MKIMVLLVLCGSFFFLLSGMSSKDRTGEGDKTTFHPKYAHQVIDQFKERMRKDYGLECCGYGGSMPTDIRSLSVDFHSSSKANIPQAREVLLDVIDIFVSIVNSHEDVRPFLREYPFPASRVSLRIDFKEVPEGESLGRIESVLFTNEKFFYTIRNKQTFDHIKIYEESYEEARRIVYTS